MTATRSMMITMFALTACNAAGDPPPTEALPRVQAPAAPDPAAEVARGEYLVTSAGCHDCHTPLEMGPNGPAPDMTRALSGHPAEMVMPPPPPPAGPWLVSVAATNTAWSGPWGVSFTANLTPDRKTGLGTWTRQNFIDTIRNGRHLGAGRPLLPPMPAAVYANFTDADLGAMFAYLQTLPALANRVPDPLPPAVAATGPKGDVISKQ